MRTAPREGGAEVGYVDKDWPIERNRFRHPPQLDPWHPIGEIAHDVVVAVLFHPDAYNDALDLELLLIGPHARGFGSSSRKPRRIW